jgi:hypothetical protein
VTQGRWPSGHPSNRPAGKRLVLTCGRGPRAEADMRITPLTENLIQLTRLRFVNAYLRA